MKKPIHYYIYFFLPFLIWLWIYFLKLDLIVVFKRPVYEPSLIIPLEDLWQVVLIFAIFQVGNEILMRLFKNYKIFTKIQLIFIFCHLLIAFYLLIFNFFSK